jgi:hypothetical protein
MFSASIDGKRFFARALSKDHGAEEDHIVVDFVKKNGTKKWSLIARQLNGRLGKQCRERWYVCAAMAL